MICCSIPGYGELRIEHCVSDFSGTPSEDGHLLPGVRERITSLAEKVQILILTADTHGRAAGELEGLRCVVRFLTSGDHTAEKRRSVESLGAEGAFALDLLLNTNRMTATLRR